MYVCIFTTYTCTIVYLHYILYIAIICCYYKYTIYYICTYTILHINYVLYILSYIHNLMCIYIYIHMNVFTYLYVYKYIHYIVCVNIYIYIISNYIHENYIYTLYHIISYCTYIYIYMYIHIYIPNWFTDSLPKTLHISKWQKLHGEANTKSHSLEWSCSLEPSPSAPHGMAQRNYAIDFLPRNAVRVKNVVWKSWQNQKKWNSCSLENHPTRLSSHVWFPQGNNLTMAFLVGDAGWSHDNKMRYNLIVIYKATNRTGA